MTDLHREVKEDAHQLRGGNNEINNRFSFNGSSFMQVSDCNGWISAFRLILPVLLYYIGLFNHG